MSNLKQFDHNLQKAKRQHRAERDEIIKTQIKMYLDYWNNFLTLKGFADHYNISQSKANKIIIAGRYWLNKAEYKLE